MLNFYLFVFHSFFCIPSLYSAAVRLHLRENGFECAACRSRAITGTNSGNARIATAQMACITRCDCENSHFCSCGLKSYVRTYSFGVLAHTERPIMGALGCIFIGGKSRGL